MRWLRDRSDPGRRPWGRTARRYCCRKRACTTRDRGQPERTASGRVADARLALAVAMLARDRGPQRRRTCAAHPRLLAPRPQPQRRLLVLLDRAGVDEVLE